MKGNSFSACTFIHWIFLDHERIRRTLLTVSLSIIAFQIFSQGEVPVNMYTGQPSIGVPIAAVTSHDITVPVSLTYDVNSANSKSPFGYGWNLSAGGSISREVRGLPDDLGYGIPRKGWLYAGVSANTMAYEIGNFEPGSDTLASTLVDMPGEYATHAKLNSYEKYFDTEPDIFNFSAGGVSGSFVFDNDLTIRTIPYVDVLIEPIYTSASDKTIVGFTIKTNDGYVYRFNDREQLQKRSVKAQFVDKVNYFIRDFELYDDEEHGGFTTFTTGWNVSTIESPTGSSVSFTYDLGEDRTSTTQVNVGYYQILDPLIADATDLVVRNIYRVETKGMKDLVKRIEGSSGMTVDFNYEYKLLTSVVLADTRRGAEGKVKTLMLSYESAEYLDANSLPAYSRNFLSSINEVSGCDKIPSTRFTYFGINGQQQKAATLFDAWGFEAGYSDESHSMPKVYIYPSAPASERYRLSPIPNSTAIILNGVDRNATGMNIMGSLQSITWPHGAMTHFTFESNRYFDAPANLDALAGGLRIQSIRYFDGFNQQPVVKLFEYTDPVTGKSSGQLLRKPVLAFPAFKWKNPYYMNATNVLHDKQYGLLSGDDVWKFLTMRSETDVTPSERTQGNTVGYAFVRVLRPGAGSATFEYRMPAMFGKTSSGEWSSSVNNFARPNANSEMGIAGVGGRWTYPHAPNPDFDYNRGLIRRKSDYNEAGQLVQRTITNYQPLYKMGMASEKVWGLRLEKFAASDDLNASDRIYQYGKYFLLTDATVVPSSELTKTYQPGDTTTATSVKTEYYYQGSLHRLMTSVKTTLADGTERRTYFRYAADYPNTVAPAENAVSAIGALNASRRYTMPIETVNTLKKPSQTENVMSGSVTLFDSFNQADPQIFPASVSSWVPSASVPFSSAFFSNVQLESGINKFKMATGYRKEVEFQSYSPKGQLIASRDLTKRVTASTHYDDSTSLPVVRLENALMSEVAFSNFDDTTGLEFSSAAIFLGSGRTEINAYYPGNTLHKTLTKAANKYVLSFWIKTSASLTLDVALKNTSATTSYSTEQIVVSAGNGIEFKYVQKIISLNAVPSGDFRIEIQAPSLSGSPAGGSSPSLLPVIDDVFFFPEQASMVSYDYAIPFGVTTTTTALGDAVHTVYDQLGRVKYQKDRDGNIVKRNKYNYASNENPLVAQFAAYEGVIYDSVTFTAADNPCLTGVTYEWNVGNGFVPGGQSFTHVFTQTGVYNVKLKVIHPIHGEKIAGRQFIVKPLPMSFQICSKGVSVYNAQTSTTTVTSSCSEISASVASNEVIFRAVSIMNCTGTCSFTWKMKEQGAFSSVIVGTGIQYKFPKVGPSTKTFLVECEMRSSDGAVATSTPIQVTIE